jgi:hypothetical protein
MLDAILKVMGNDDTCTNWKCQRCDRELPICFLDLIHHNT